MLVWIEFLLLGYFCFTALYSLIFSIAGLFYRSPAFFTTKASKYFKLAVLIPSYKEDGVIVSVARQALQQTYPRDQYDVIVIADSLQPTTVEELKKLPIIVHEVKFEKSTKVKSLQSALQTYPNYDGVVILDADNVMQPTFLEKINQCFNAGWKAIQGQRTAKNKNTPLAILDGISESIANHINRKGSIALGLSSPIIGSGMAYDYQLLNGILQTMDAVGGFDKELQLRVLSQGEKIHYVNDAIVLDEKVDSPEVFENQRKRWMSSHYIYFRKFFVMGLAHLFKGNVSIFNISILHNLQLPRMMNLGLMFMTTTLAIVLHPFLHISYWYWIATFFAYAFSFLIAIPKSYFNRDLLTAILAAPQTFITIFALHFKLKGANKKFIHTPHKHQ